MDNLTIDSRRTAHLCLDMQKMFAEDTEWRTPWMDRVLPVVTEIATRHKEQTFFTRFIPPARTEDAQGCWRKYFSRWRSFTLEELDPELLELVEPLRPLAPPARVIDKPGFSPFQNTDLADELRLLGVETLVVTGAETDVCVLAAVLSAIDLGFYVVLVKDGLCSSADETHDALLTLYGNRFSQQLQLVTFDDLMKAWPGSS
jgi:nicotinamidase-related amidase